MAKKKHETNRFYRKKRNDYKKKEKQGDTQKEKKRKRDEKEKTQQKEIKQLGISAHHVHHMSLSSGNAQSVSLAVSFVRLFPPVQRIDKEGRDAPDVKFRRVADSTLPLHSRTTILTTVQLNSYLKGGKSQGGVGESNKEDL